MEMLTEHKRKKKNNNLSYPLFSLAIALAVLLVMLPTTTAYAQQQEDEDDNNNDNDGNVVATILTEGRQQQQEDDAEEEEATITSVNTSRTTIVEEEAAEEEIDDGVGNGIDDGLQTYQDVNRAEVIADDGTIANPGGEGNQDIDIAGEETMTRPTNLEENVLPQTTQLQEYEDFKLALQASGYSIADMQPTLAHKTNIPLIIVRGSEGTPSQPNLMMLEDIAATYGYSVLSHMFIDNAWETTFASATGY